MEYEAKEKAIRDYNQAIYEAEERGEQRVNKLHSLLIQQKRYADLERSVSEHRVCKINSVKLHRLFNTPVFYL